MLNKNLCGNLAHGYELVSLREAVLDALFLLEKGYSREKVRDLVGDKYGLDRALRSIIYRCVHTDDWISRIKAKSIYPPQIKGKKIAVDFLNVLGAVISAISGGLIVRSLDGFIRDISELHASILRHQKAYEAAELIISVVSASNPSKIIFLLEVNISHSGDFASFIRKKMRELGIDGDAITSRTVDSEIIRTGYVVATSDAVIMMRVERLIDLADLTISKITEPNYRLIDLQKLVRSDWWCSNVI